LRLSVSIATELALSRTRHFDLKFRPGSFLYDRNGFWLFYRKSTLDISADDRDMELQPQSSNATLKNMTNQ